MTELLSDIDSPSDAELISRVRGGDVTAYGELFSRHVQAATRLARQLVRGPDADDLVSDAFAKVLTVLQEGGGPDVAFRAYLLTAVRRLHVDRMRAGSRLQTSDDMTMFDPGIPFQDTAVSGFESGAAAKAFASLPERWQLVLWHLEVEGQKPADIAPLLGMSANSVSALAYRAREGLRQAFLTMHLSDISAEECRWVNEHLGAYVRNGLAKRDAAKVDAHLKECRRCTAMYLELTEVNSNLKAIIAPLLLGAAAAGYLSSTGTAGTAGALAVLGRLRDAVLANASVAATGAAAAGVAAVTTTVVLMTHHGAAQTVSSADQPVAATTQVSSAGAPSGAASGAATTARSASSSPAASSTVGSLALAPASPVGTPGSWTTPGALPSTSGAGNPVAPGGAPGTGPGTSTTPSSPASSPAGTPSTPQSPHSPTSPSTTPTPPQHSTPPPTGQPTPAKPGPTSTPTGDPSSTPTGGSTGGVGGPTTGPTSPDTTPPNTGGTGAPGGGSTGGTGGTASPTFAPLAIGPTGPDANGRFPVQMSLTDLPDNLGTLTFTVSPVSTQLGLSQFTSPTVVSFAASAPSSLDETVAATGGTCSLVDPTTLTCNGITGSALLATFPVTVSPLESTTVKITATGDGVSTKSDALLIDPPKADITLSGLTVAANDNGNYTIRGQITGIPASYSYAYPSVSVASTDVALTTVSSTMCDSPDSAGNCAFTVVVTANGIADEAEATVTVGSLPGYIDGSDGLANNSLPITLEAPAPPSTGGGLELSLDKWEQETHDNTVWTVHVAVSGVEPDQPLVFQINDPLAATDKPKAVSIESIAPDSGNTCPSELTCTPSSGTFSGSFQIRIPVGHETSATLTVSDSSNHTATQRLTPTPLATDGLN